MTYSGDLMNFNEILTGIIMELDDIIMDIFWNHITFKNKKNVDLKLKYHVYYYQYHHYHPSI